MATLEKPAVEGALASVLAPHTGTDLVDGKSVAGVSITGDTVNIQLKLGYPADSWHGELRQLVIAVSYTHLTLTTILLV